MSETAGERIVERFPDHVVGTSKDLGDDVVVVRREGLLDVLAFLKKELGFNLPLDVTCIDYKAMAPGKPEHVKAPSQLMFSSTNVPLLGKVDGARFEVVYHIRRMTDAAIIRIKVPLTEDDPVVPSAYGIYNGVDWFERETFDMFGIRFDGHPNLKRILLYPEFKGHPLRKDYPRRGYQPRMEMPRLKGDAVSDME